MRPVVFAVSGVKNAGKTTLAEKLVRALCAAGWRVATIKHDGHSFAGDVPGTDSYRHKQAGAVCATVCSDSRVAMVRDWAFPSPEELIALQPPVDFILLEGFKSSGYRKIEVARAAVSKGIVCDPLTLLAVATDLPLALDGVPVVGLEDIEKLLRLVLALRQ